MIDPAPAALTARKTPRQSRAKVTLDAIFEAAIQVLIRDGMASLTTTRVAERAGVSVGTMYQYFPNKQALIYALNARYLEALAERIEATCQSQHGAAINQMIDALIDTYWRAKTERAEATRALYKSVVEMDNDALVQRFAARTNEATRAMLISAPNVQFRSPDITHLTLVTVIFGAVRNVFERNLDPPDAEALRVELIAMCQAYVAAARL
ncbi:TetR/AcrR family transcriptional regulator [Phaeobacter sp. J2-8]|uniref:TetR/AcrR family transcriptional regulator n=1 Tax=Phaeobacter sp. J2-8 TaxID=2931394 RepID=UPI001FCF95B8|nr:TetR/AcrR family transcriptional regulator [Phaeobacter sp. J2-8]MCJ7874011.1 TetR/AcrR family transcriptional regulator [Phaeobacter sp. J2-8]